MLKEMVIPNYLTFLLRNLYPGQKATGATMLQLHMEQGTGSKLGKECIKAVSRLPYFFNLYAEYIMQNAKLDEAQAGIKFAGRNISNLRYAGHHPNGRK